MNGKLDMVIAFDTTGSMAAYIEDLRLGIVAFGDYCDMANRETFGDAYQCIPLTGNETAILR